MGQLKNLKCTKCLQIQETYTELVYSQGSLVCLACKKDLQESDNRAFDRDMRKRCWEVE
jgi:hypothetical protein